MAVGVQPKVFLAGRVEIQVGGNRLGEERFPGRQGRLIFAYLVAEAGRPVPRDELAEAVWGNAKPATWEKAITVVASKLRGLLAEAALDGPSVLTSAFSCYRLQLPPGSWVDVIAAESVVHGAEAALARSAWEEAKSAASIAASILEQPFLPGEDGLWVEKKRRELADLRCRAVNALADACLRSGDAVEAATWAEQAIALAPFREMGYRRLMEAHATAGNGAEALQVYERCRRLLADELGAYPSPETESMFRELLVAPTGEAVVEPRQAPGPDHDPGGAVVDGAPGSRPQRRWPGHPRRVAEVRGPPTAFPAPEAERATAGRRSRLLALVGLGLAVAAGAVVLAVTLGHSGSAHALARLDADSAGSIDPRDNRLVSEVAVGSGPGKLTSGFGSVWVVNDYGSTVSRVDPVTGTSQDTIQVDADPTAIAVGGDSVWVTSSGTRQLDRINPQTDTVVQRTAVGDGPSGVSVSPGALWVTNRLDDTVTEIDSHSGKTRRTLPSGASPSAVAYGLGALWITNETAATVTRLDLDTGALEEVAVGNGPSGVAIGGGAVWVVNSLDGTVSRLDPTQNVVSAVITVGTGPSSVLVSDGSVWVADSYAGRVDRIDAATDRITATVSVGGGPQSLASFDGVIWVTARQAPTGQRGGVLRLYDLTKPDSFDQSFSYASNAWEELANTSDGLVGFKRVGGLEGGTMVADLATSLPLATDGGLTYTFHLRHGIRYSTGMRVRATDFRRGLERAFRIGNPYASYYYTGIVGASACSKVHCDLSRGIVADDRSDTVTIHLRAADPELFYKLALPAAWPVPPGTPMTRPQLLGVPGTGPYMVRSWAHDRLVLVRNPRFRSWSAAAQPNGYPDRIVVIYKFSPDAQLTAVEHGKADLMVAPPASRENQIETQYAAQVHSLPVTEVYGIFMNTRVPPFNSLAARQAVNFAIDRSKAISGSFGGAVTCQILPPGIPGYRPYCPFTSHPTSRGGLWTGPDLARARTLVARSGTYGAKVTLWTHDLPAAAAISNVAVASLRELGYRVTLKVLSHDAYWQHVNTASNRSQAGFIGWSQDYPAPSEFLSELTCSAFSTGVAANSNQAGFCNSRFDRAYARALASQATDSPQAVNAAWAAVDRLVTDLSPWAPLYNPRDLVFVSKRVRTLESNPEWGVLTDQIRVR